MPQESVNLINIANKILDSTKLFETSDWPAFIHAPSEKTSGFFSSSNIFWDNIKSIRRFTDASLNSFQKDKEYNGSTGWEYSFIMAYFHNKFYYSKFKNSKSYTEVRSSHSLKVESDFNFESQECVDNLLLDDFKVDKVIWPNSDSLKKRNELIQSGLYKPIFIANFHTHPVTQYPKFNKNIYTFFSLQDMQSFFNSNLFLTGLVTNKLWIACKTTNSKIPSDSDLALITQAEFENPENLEKIAGEIMGKYSIVLYVAKFGEVLRRVS